MNTTLILVAVAFLLGLVWGFAKPAGYCSMSREQQHGFGNRLGSGVINGGVLGIIVFVVASVFFGTGLS